MKGQSLPRSLFLDVHRGEGCAQSGIKMKFPSADNSSVARLLSSTHLPRPLSKTHNNCPGTPCISQNTVFFSRYNRIWLDHLSLFCIWQRMYFVWHLNWNFYESLFFLLELETEGEGNLLCARQLWWQMHERNREEISLSTTAFQTPTLSKFFFPSNAEFHLFAQTIPEVINSEAANEEACMSGSSSYGLQSINYASWVSPKKGAVCTVILKSEKNMIWQQIYVKDVWIKMDTFLQRKLKNTKKGGNSSAQSKPQGKGNTFEPFWL